MEATARYCLRSMATAVGSALRLRNPLPTDVNHEASTNNASATSDHGDNGDNGDEFVYNPSVQDILKVKDIIQEASNMPLELIDEVIDFAEYWACSSTVKSTPPQSVEGTSGHADHRQSRSNVLVVSIPLNIQLYACRCWILC